MESRKDRYRYRNRTGKGRGRSMRGARAFLLTAGLAVLLAVLPAPAAAPEISRAGTPPAIPASAPEEETAPAYLDFRMSDLLHGVLQTDRGMLRTEDGGAHWQAADGAPLEMPGTTDDSSAAIREISGPDGPIPVKRLQFVTERVGWALADISKDGKVPIWITVDGGASWHATFDDAVKQGLAAELERKRRHDREAAYFADAAAADRVMAEDWALLPDKVGPGDVVLVHGRKPATFAWQGKSYTLEPFGTGYYAYVPVSITTKPGTYRLGDADLTVERRDFAVDRLTVSQQLESIKEDTERINADQKKIDKARSVSADTFLFAADSAFLQPVEGRISTPFGYTRYVNGKYDGSHTALDIAAPEGTPVKATNDGIVVLADKLYLTGNSVYIDHGMQLFSQYIHMSELKVKAGDKVKKGQVIGLVGQTGFATGPHLHFTFWAHNVPVDPNPFFGSTPFHWASENK